MAETPGREPSLSRPSRVKPHQHELAIFHAEICQALADSTRIAILYELADEPRNVSELVDALAQPQPTISRHLRTLRDCGVLKARRDGGHVIYNLTDQRVIDALDLLRAALADILSDRGRLARELQQD